MNKRFENAIQAAVLAGSIVAAGGLAASCDDADAKSKKSSSSTATVDETVLGVDGGTVLGAQSDPFTLTGTKQAGTGVWVNGVEAVAPDSSSAWTADVDVSTGENLFTLVARDNRDRQIDTLSVSVFYVPAPTVDGGTSQSLSVPGVLTGTKAAGAALIINGALAIPPNPDTTWSVSLETTPIPGLGEGVVQVVLGPNTLDIQAELEGHDSATVTVSLTATADTTPPTLLGAFTMQPCNDIVLQFSEPVVWNGGYPPSYFQLYGNRHVTVSTLTFVYDDSAMSGYASPTASFVYADNIPFASVTGVSFTSSSFAPTGAGNDLILPMFRTQIPSAYAHNNQVRLKYTQSPTGITDLAGNELASFSLAGTGEGFVDILNSVGSAPASFCSYL